MDNIQSDITLRPSSISTFVDCPHKFYRTFINVDENIEYKTNARAALGTSVHHAAEKFWLNTMETGKRDYNLSYHQDAAIEEFKELQKEGLDYVGDKPKDIEELLLTGTEVFLRDIAPEVETPVAVEKRYSIAIDNPIFARVSGSIDYLTEDGIHDIKTTKKSPSLRNYQLQQGTYALLREGNGEPVNELKIQAVIFNKNPVGRVYDMQDSVRNVFADDRLGLIKEQARLTVNNILDTAKLTWSDTVDPNLLWRGNSGSYLCSDSYCPFYSKCKFVVEGV